MPILRRVISKIYLSGKNMPVKVKCSNPACARVMLVRDAMAGKKGKCPACGTVLNIPDRPSAAYDLGIEEKPCPECGRKISAMETICPHCAAGLQSDEAPDEEKDAKAPAESAPRPPWPAVALIILAFLAGVFLFAFPSHVIIQFFQAHFAVSVVRLGSNKLFLAIKYGGLIHIIFAVGLLLGISWARKGYIVFIGISIVFVMLNAIVATLTSGLAFKALGAFLAVLIVLLLLTFARSTYEYFRAGAALGKWHIAIAFAAALLALPVYKIDAYIKNLFPVITCPEKLKELGASLKKVSERADSIKTSGLSEEELKKITGLSSEDLRRRQVCPETGKPYIFIRQVMYDTTLDPKKTPVVYDTPGAHKGYINVLYLDGRVEKISGDDVQLFLDSLPRQDKRK